MKIPKIKIDWKRIELKPINRIKNLWCKTYHEQEWVSLGGEGRYELPPHALLHCECGRNLTQKKVYKYN